MAIIETIPFSFDETYSYIEQKFKDAGYTVGEGSNTMQLVTAMSYLTSMLNANTAVNINETILTLARKRETVLRDARTLGYEIDHVQSYRYDLLVNFTALQTYSIVEYTSFTAGSNTYYYMGDQLEDFTVTDNTTVHYYGSGITQLQAYAMTSTSAVWDTELKLATFANLDGLAADHATVLAVKAELESIGGSLGSYYGAIKKLEVREGTLHKYQNFPNTLIKFIDVTNEYDEVTGGYVEKVQYYVDVPFTNIEENGLHVYLTYIDEEGQRHDKEKWEKSATFMIEKDTVLNKEWVRLDDIEYKTPRIYFKLGEIGKELRVGTFIYINALESKGALGEIPAGELPEPTQLNATVIAADLVLQGTDEESIESIKQNAPLFHNTANRVITKPDYIAFCNRQSPVEMTYVWDGHDEYPKRPGHIWFSFIPSSNVRALLPVDNTTNAEYQLSLATDRINWYVEDQEIIDVWSYLENYRVPTLEYHHRHPIYMNFNYEIEVIKYSVASTHKDQHTVLFNVVDEYFKGASTVDPVESFKYEYFQSNLTRRIDDVLTDITGFNISLHNEVCFCVANMIDEIADYDVDGVTVLGYFKEVRIHLGLPYEKTINEDGSIVTEHLPTITTANFAGTANTLYVDIDGPTIITTVSPIEEITSYNIKMGDPVARTGYIVGEYRVFNVADPDIELILWVTDPDDVTAGFGHETGIDYDYLNTNNLKINVNYPSPNIRFSRNTIPRLHNVKFI